jgi:NAD(P)-dependent dehydrogenase (short-subunit alcohol dehydrogenase family)
MLLERNMPELTGEAIVLRYARQFGAEVVAAARRRLEAAGTDVAALPGAEATE